MKQSLLILIFLISQQMQAQLPVLNNITPLTDNTGRFEKFEAVLDLNASYNNPYHYDEILIQAIFTAPSGRRDTVEGFYLQDYELNTSSVGILSTKGNGDFYLRFCPDEVGTWVYLVTVQTQTGTSNSLTGSFDCMDSESKGFIRRNETNYLSFDNGEPYFPIGENLAWQNGSAYYANYNQWLNKLAENKANFIRLWLAHWGLGIEWRNGFRDFPGLGRYNQQTSWYLDWIVEQCRQKDIYIMFCINHHGQVSSNVNPNWSENPYNAAQGGPCSQTSDFFTNEQARSLHKNRLRYILARWGYSPHIMAWELFNEVNFTDNYEDDNVKTAVRNWHDEMGRFLKEKDVRQHLVTTSVSTDKDPQIWDLPVIDLTQSHLYVGVENVEQIAVGLGHELLEKHGKPTFTGEFGINPANIALSNIDPTGIYVHNTIWATAFSGALGAGATWWWDNYMHPQDLYYHFLPLASMMEQITLRRDDYLPAITQTGGGGGSGELVISPGAGWAESTEATAIIDERGNVSIPPNKLGQFLYGAQWNTHLRNPPTFEVSFIREGKFTVRTGGNKSTNPSIAIYLDGVLKEDFQDAAINTAYSIDVPVGQHSIKVDNLGTDWIAIASYELEGLATSPHIAYTVIAGMGDKAAGYIHNQRYNWKRVGEESLPPVVENGTVLVEGLEPGAYRVNYFDCLSGELLATDENVVADPAGLLLFVPDFLWDLSFTAEYTGTAVAADDQEIVPLDINIFPNPTVAGQPINLDTRSLPPGKYQLAIYNLNGQRMKSSVFQANGQIVEVSTSGLPRGQYILRVTNGQSFVVKVVVAT